MFCSAYAETRIPRTKLIPLRIAMKPTITGMHTGRSATISLKTPVSRSAVTTVERVVVAPSSNMPFSPFFIFIKPLGIDSLKEYPEKLIYILQDFTKCYEEQHTGYQDHDLKYLIYGSLLFDLMGLYVVKDT